MLHQGCSLFNRRRGVRDQKLQYKCSELNLTQALAPTFPFLTLYVCVFVPFKANLGMDLQKLKEKKNKKKQLLHYFLGALEVTGLA